MPEYYELDTIIKVGEEFEMPADRFYVIRKIGASADRDTALVIDGIPLGKVKWTCAPVIKYVSNTLGPLDLGDYFYVVPPKKKIGCEGTSGDYMRIKGEVGKLATGESLPAALLTRFEKQHREYLTYVEATFELGTDVTWTADAEHLVLELIPRTVEKYEFKYPVMVDISGDTVLRGDFAIRFYLDGKPLDVLGKEAGRRGIDVLACPRPPASTVNMEPFTLEKHPITVEGDHRFQVKAINTSGADKAPASGSSWKVTVTLICKKITS